MMDISFVTISILLNGLVSSINGRKQRNLQEHISNKTLEQGKEIAIMQMEHNIRMEHLRNSLAKERAEEDYTLRNGWPLNIAPCSYIKLFDNPKKIPLNLIIADPLCGKLNSILSNALNELGSFIVRDLQKEISPCIGQYNTHPSIKNFLGDIKLLSCKLNVIPSVFIGAYSKANEEKIILQIALWGFDESLVEPQIIEFELDLQSEIISFLREESERAINKFDKLSGNIPPRIKNNIEIFEREKELLNKGIAKNEIRDDYEIYTNLSPSKSIISNISNKISRQLQIITVMMSDCYFLMSYNEHPKLTRILKANKELQEESKSMQYIISNYEQQLEVIKKLQKKYKQKLNAIKDQERKQLAIAQNDTSKSNSSTYDVTIDPDVLELLEKFKVPKKVIIKLKESGALTTENVEKLKKYVKYTKYPISLILLIVFGISN